MVFSKNFKMDYFCEFSLYVPNFLGNTYENYNIKIEFIFIVIDFIQITCTCPNNGRLSIYYAFFRLTEFLDKYSSKIIYSTNDMNITWNEICSNYVNMLSFILFFSFCYVYKFQQCDLFWTPPQAMNSNWEKKYVVTIAILYSKRLPVQNLKGTFDIISAR